MTEDRYRKVEGVVSSEVDDEVVIMSIETGVYFGIRGAGPAIWEMLDVPRTEEALVEETAKTYGVERGACAPDVRAFLDQLLEKGLVETV